MNFYQEFYSSANYYSSDDGLELFYRDLGNTKDDVILCLPGLTRNSRDFEKLATRLALNNRVICPDLRGRGLSEYDPYWQNYHPLTYANDIWTLLNKLSINKVTIIGTSLGGLIAMLMAYQDKDRLIGVVMNDIGPEIDEKGLERIKKYAGLLPPVENWQQARDQTKQIYGPWLKGLDNNQWLIMAKRAYKENHEKQPVLDMDANISRAIQELGAQKGNPWELFAALEKVKTLVLRGELSDILSDKILAKMHKNKTDLVSVIIPDRGHVPLLDEEISTQAIDKFLQVIKS